MVSSSARKQVCNSLGSNKLMQSIYWVTLCHSLICMEWVSYTSSVQYIQVSLPALIHFSFFLVCRISTESWRKSPECLVAGLATVLVSSGLFPKSGIIVVTLSLGWVESRSCLAGDTSRDNEIELSLWWGSSLGEQQQEEAHSQPSQELLHPSESIRDFLVGLVE